MLKNIFIRTPDKVVIGGGTHNSTPESLYGQGVRFALSENEQDIVNQLAPLPSKSVGKIYNHKFGRMIRERNKISLQIVICNGLGLKPSFFNDSREFGVYAASQSLCNSYVMSLGNYRIYGMVIENWTSYTDNQSISKPTYLIYGRVKYNTVTIFAYSKGPVVSATRDDPAIVFEGFDKLGIKIGKYNMDREIENWKKGIER